MKQIEIPDILEVLAKHFDMQKPEAFKMLKTIFSPPDTTTLFGIFFELRKYNVKPAMIMQCVSDITSVPVDIMKSQLRKREIVEARQAAMYFIAHLTSLSLKLNGAMFGGRDHTTVIHAMQTVDNLLDSDHLYKEKITEIARTLLEKYKV